ncbi:MAG: RidA family protein [Thermomicrobiales bacterium]|nr:RidA family protein [Thermomicrobiales bacterium]
MQPPASSRLTPRRAILATLLAPGLAGMSRTGMTRQSEGEDTAMPTTITHLSPEGMHRNPAYSQAVVVANPGATVYIGGQNAVNAQGEIVGKGDLAAQTEQIFVNLGIVLEAAGATLHDIVKWTMFLVEGVDLRPGFEVFQKHWGTGQQPPVISAAMVSSLAHPDFLVEIEAVAIVRA